MMALKRLIYIVPAGLKRLAGCFLFCGEDDSERCKITQSSSMYIVFPKQRHLDV